MQNKNPQPNPRLKLIGIVRVSTENQAGDDKAGIPRQREAVQRIADAYKADLKIVEIRGVSGSDVADTPEWLRDVVPHLDGTTHIAADAIDRIIRADAFDFRTLATIQATGTKIYTPTGIQDLSQPSHALMTGIFALIGGNEKREIQRRMNAGAEVKRKHGDYPMGDHSLPTGISFDRKTKRWGFTPEADKIRECFRLYVSESRTANYIAGKMGKPRSTIRQWLGNPIYKGLMGYRKGDADRELLVRVFPPEEQLISDDVWEAAQRRTKTITKSHTKRRTRTAPEIVFSGYITSAHEPLGPMSGGFFPLDLSKPAKHVVWGHSQGVDGCRYKCHCRAFAEPRPKPRCGLATFDAQTLNKALDRYFVAMCSEPWFVQAIEAEGQGGDHKRDPEEERKAIQKALGSLKKKEDRLVDLYTDGDLSREMYDRKRAAIRTEIADLEVQLAALDNTGKPDVSAISEAARKLTFNPAWSVTEKREWLTRHVTTISISNDGVEHVVLRLPSGIEGSDALPVSFRLAEARSWLDLVGHDPTDYNDRRVAKRGGAKTIGQVAEILGLSVDQLRRLCRKGILPEPGRIGRYRLWTPAEVDRARETLKAKRHR